MKDFQIGTASGTYRSGFINNDADGGGVRIHYIEKDCTKRSLPSLVFSPGLWEPAERAIPLFDGLDCHCVSLSYRGRGRSDTPPGGYDLKHHVSDLRAVVEALDLKSFVIVAFSRGVGYACGYMREDQGKVKGLVLVDHPPVHVQPAPGYAEYWKNLIYLGHRITESMRPEALDGIEREAREVMFWDFLSTLNVPVAVLRGTSKSSKIVSELTDEDMARYRKCLEDFREVNFEHSGHMIVDEELGKYREVVNEFVQTLCAPASVEQKGRP